jgi:hypothetical protein
LVLTVLQPDGLHLRVGVGAMFLFGRP